MTNEELKALYSVAYKFFQAERTMRDRVFPAGHPQREKKLAQCDLALQAVTRMKDFAKLYTEESPEQVELLADPVVMRKGGY